MASPHRLSPPNKGDVFAGAVFEEVVGEVAHGKGKQSIWRLRCSCGDVIEKKASYIRSLVKGDLKAKCENYQVNHSKIKIGQKYNRLNVRKLTREYVLNKKTNKHEKYINSLAQIGVPLFCVQLGGIFPSKKNFLEKAREKNIHIPPKTLDKHLDNPEKYDRNTGI